MLTATYGARMATAILAQGALEAACSTGLLTR
jgi:hypothetical protein